MTIIETRASPCRLCRRVMVEFLNELHQGQDCFCQEGHPSSSAESEGESQAKDGFRETPRLFFSETARRNSPTESHTQ